jgi:hypothetical protein
MAKKMIELLTDDLDGSEADATLAFSVDGVSYELELNAENRDKFDRAVAPFVAAARRVRGSSTQRGPQAARSGSKRADLNDIRTWARKQGWDVSDRGRVPADVVAAYDEAH